MNLYSLFRKSAFCFDPEFIHEFVLNTGKTLPFLGRIFSNPIISEKFQLSAGPLKWPYPVGLAAGLDKNAHAINFFECFPFGCIEVGTITLKAQEGNPKPRMFRLPEQKSLRNQMGFNNLGAKVLEKNIRSTKITRPLGINIGKNKLTPLEKSIDDYIQLAKIFAPLSQYLVINISSPNTPGLRQLQERKYLQELLGEVRKVCPDHPVFVKVDPDRTFRDYEEIVEISHDCHLSGILATNTTVIPEYGSGGISGQLLTKKAETVRNFILKSSAQTSLQVIGVGGINEFEQLYNFWKNGGKLAQIYTAFIYQGPRFFNNITKNIFVLLEMTQSKNLEEAIGKIRDIEFKDVFYTSS